MDEIDSAEPTTAKWVPDYPQAHPVYPTGMGYDDHSGGKAWTCQRCGSVVADLPMHDTWHRHVEEPRDAT